MPRKVSESLVRFHVTVAEILRFGDVSCMMVIFEFPVDYLLWPHEGILQSRGDSGRSRGIQDIHDS